MKDPRLLLLLRWKRGGGGEGGDEGVMRIGLAVFLNTFRGNYVSFLEFFLTISSPLIGGGKEVGAWCFPELM